MTDITADDQGHGVAARPDLLTRRLAAWVIDIIIVVVIGNLILAATSFPGWLSAVVLTVIIIGYFALPGASAAALRRVSGSSASLSGGLTAVA